mgnify:CR=1 FL=1
MSGNILTDIVVDIGKEVAADTFSSAVGNLFGDDKTSGQQPKLPVFQESGVASQKNVESVARGTQVAAAEQPQRSGTGTSYHQALIRSFGRVATEGTIGRSISKTDLG